MRITPYDVALKSKIDQYLVSDRDEIDPSGSYGINLADLLSKRTDDIHSWSRKVEAYVKDSQNPTFSRLSPGETFYRRATQLHLVPHTFANIQDKRNELKNVLGVNTSQMDDSEVRALFAKKYFQFKA